MTPCLVTFEALNAYVDGQLAPSEELDVRRHLDLCSGCRSQVEALLAVKEAVAASAEVRPVPHTLRERLASLERPPRRRRGAWLLGLGALAAAVLLAVGAARLIGRAPQADRERVIEALVADHLHFLQVHDAVEFASDDPARIAAWFADKVPFPVRLPALGSATLLGGRLCSLWGHRVALAFYLVDGKRVSLFVADEATVPAGGRLEAGCGPALADHRVCFVPASPTLLALVADESQTAALLPELQALVPPRS
jgi:anti-sigma factor RsiW